MLLALHIIIEARAVQAARWWICRGPSLRQHPELTRMDPPSWSWRGKQDGKAERCALGVRAIHHSSGARMAHESHLAVASGIPRLQPRGGSSRVSPFVKGNKKAQSHHPPGAVGHGQLCLQWTVVHCGYKISSKLRIQPPSYPVGYEAWVTRSRSGGYS